MKAAPHQSRHRAGVTLLEMTLVILVLLTLLGAGFGSTAAYRSWSRAREASETLRTVYVAQRTFLADHPTTTVSTLTPALLAPYLPGTPTSLPTAKSLDDTTLTARVNVSPPYWTTTTGGTSGTRYDPSGSNTDSLWDVGE